MQKDKFQARKKLRELGLYDEVMAFFSSDEAKKIIDDEFNIMCNKIKKACNVASEELKPALESFSKSVIENKSAFVADVEETLIINILSKMKPILKAPNFPSIIEDFKKELRSRDHYVMHLIGYTCSSVGIGTYNMFIVMATEYFLSNSK